MPELFTAWCLEYESMPYCFGTFTSRADAEAKCAESTNARINKDIPWWVWVQDESEVRYYV
jgi:hypothetical protein